MLLEVSGSEGNGSAWEGIRDKVEEDVIGECLSGSGSVKGNIVGLEKDPRFVDNVGSLLDV